MGCVWCICSWIRSGDGRVTVYCCSMAHERDSKDIDHRVKNRDGMATRAWNMTQCYYAVKGGITANIPDLGYTERERRPMTISAEGIRLLSFVGLLPCIREDQIHDKSKGNWMGKSIVCIQASWLVAQVVGRLILGLTVSLLEINTCGHVACAFALYVLWWNKALDINSPIFLQDAIENRGPRLSETLSLMFVCSKISAVDGVSPIRCFEYLPPGCKTRLYPSQDEESSDHSGTVSIVRFSTGSQGIRNWSKFLGDVTLQPFTKKDGNDLVYVQNQKLITTCKVYLKPEYQVYPLRHCDRYCRGGKALTTLASAQLLGIANATDEIWKQCSKRLSYGRYYFAYCYVFRPGLPVEEQAKFYKDTPCEELEHFTSHPINGHELKICLGECMGGYVVPYARNLPSLENLSLGHINISRDALKSVFAATAIIYGGLHLSAWNDLLPSKIERILWIASSLIIASSGAVLWVVFGLKTLWNSASAMNEKIQVDNWKTKTQQMSLYILLLIFAAARIFLVVEAFVSLRKAPKEVYQTPKWTDFFPHL